MSSKSKAQQQEQWEIPSPKILYQWLEQFNRDALEFANAQGKQLKSKRASSSQIRKIFGTLKDLELQIRSDNFSNDWELKLLMMKPRIAYLAGRHSEIRNAKLDKLISSIVDLIVEETSDQKKQTMFLNFVQLFEAVLAYFKYYESVKQHKRK